MFKNLLSFQGRMRRRDFWVSAILLPVLAVIAMFTAVYLFRKGNQLVLGLSIFCFLILLAIHELAENTRRCHDIGMSGWMQLIPFFMIVLFFKEGDKGPNKYGPDPKDQTIENLERASHRPIKRSQFDEEMAAIRAERGSSSTTL
jgi:uncharacterized membrane protein YhaH (DUF805 family)